MTSFRKAIRFCSLVLTLGVPFAASAATFDVKTLIDTDNNRGTGCNVVTPGGIVSGIDVMITTAGSVNGSTGTVTTVTRQTCVNSVLNQFSSPTAVDGGWNVGVSPIGDVFVESHMGLDVLTMDNIGTPRFVFIASSGLSSDVLLTPWSWGGGDIIMPHAARDRAVTPTLPRNILLDGLSPDWAGNVPLANGTAAPPVWRFISAGAYAGLHDLFFNFQIHTNGAAPTAHDDNYAVSTLGGTLTVATLGVLNNDNPNNQPITASLVDTTQHGTLALAPNGGFVYIHDGSLASQDQFHYVAVGTTLSSNVATVTIDLPGTHPYTFTSANNVTFIDGQPNTFLVTVTGKPTPELSVTGDLPAGVTFHDNGDGTGVLSGTPAANTSGDYHLVFFADKNKPHNSSQNFTLTVTCPGVSVVNPAVTTGTAGTPFSQTFTQNGGTPPVTFTLNSGTLPPGLTLSPGGVLSGTPTGSGTFPITVKVTDVGGCTAVGPTYNLVISCHPVTVNNPATSTGTATVAFSQTFTQSGAIGGATFALNSGTLPAGLTLSGAGVLSGTPTQTGSFPITIKVTDGEGCVGVGPTYNLSIGCQTITVTNPATNTGVAAAAFSQTFTAGNTIGAVTFSTASTLPTGLTLSSAGVLSGTPTQTGSFPIVVKATDANGCFGNGATYTLTITCQTITVNNPATNTGTVNTAFSQTFTAPAAIGATAFTLNSGTLPAGITLSAAGVLSGTPTQTGSFPVTVKATDANGCFGISATYTLTIGCQVFTVNNPATNSGTVNVAFSQNFTTTNSIGAVTFTLNSGTLPTGITLSSAGVLSGTPTQIGSFPITVHAVDANGCSANGATYTLTIGCQTITVNNPATSTGTVNVAFSQTFTSSNAIGAVTYSTSSTLPTGITLNSSTGVLSGTPTQSGTFPIVVHAVDANGCSGNGATYTLVIGCQIITVNNPATNSGTVNTVFGQTFTSSNTIGTVTYTLNSGTLPAGLSLSTGGVLSGTPTQTGSFPITVTATDANGCSGTGATYTLTIGCQTITVNNPATTTGTVNAAFSQSFTAGNTVGTLTFTTASTLPAGLSLSTAGVLSGTPTQTGSFPIVVHVVDGNGCSGNGATYTLVIGCQTISVTNPATNTGTVSAPFTVTFTSGNTIGTVTYTTASTLPAGITLNSATGVLSGTPTQSGTFPIVVTATDANGCSGSGATYTLVIGCQVITVNNPATTSSPAGTPLSINFTQSGAIGTATFTTASTLPTGLTLDPDGTLHGTPSGNGPFPISVTVTDANGCTGTNAAYTLTLTCPTITVTNPATNSGTAGVAFTATFTQAGGQGTITWSETGALPAGITLNSSTGVLAGTTNTVGSFPITVTATDSNGCTGTGATYTLTINCQTITVTNPGVNTGTVDAAFSQTFTKTGILGTVTWSETGALPAGITLNSATGVLSGTPTVKGTFPITVTATDTNGCSGSSPYTLTINCQTITVTNPGVNTGTVDAPFSQSFGQSAAHGTATFTTASTLPAGLTLSTAGVLSGTPTVKGTFPIVVTVTDSNSCTGTNSPAYNLTINCQTITVTNPATTTGTSGTAFSQTFTQSGAHGTATFTTASTLPTGFTLSNTGLLSGTTTQHGSFPIVVTVTDSNGCTGTSATYTLVIACNPITVTNPATSSGTVSAAFSQTFTQSGSLGTPSFTTASTLPAGLTLHSATGVLDGTPTQSGTFPIVVTVTDSNGCTGTSATYTLIISCQTITVTNPATTSSPAGTPLSINFTQTGAIGTATFTTSSTLPTGLTLAANGTLSGTPSGSGAFPIVVTVTDSNGCTGTNPSYTLTITCPTITVTNPGVSSGTAGVAFSQTFSQSGGQGTITWSKTGALPAGITLNSATGVLSGTTNASGSFPITVTATDSNGCTGTGATYTLVINCQTITVTNPGVNTGTVDAAFSQTFTKTGILGTVTWSETGALPAGITLNSATGVLSGTPTVKGSFPITVIATDTNGCSGSSPYTLTINCQTITVTNPGVTTGTVDAPFSQSFSQTGAHGTATFTTASTLPAGLSLSTAGVLSGTPTVKGSFPIVVTVTDSNSCTGTGSTYTLVIACQTITVTNPGTTTGTAGTAFSQNFTQSGAHGTATFTTASTLPTGFSLSSAGVLSGTTTQHGTFPIVVTVTDSNSCTGTSSTYNLVIACNAITVTNPATTTGTVAAAFSQTFTSSGILGTASYTTASTLPTGLTLHSATGVLDGTPTQSGTFPIVVTATDSNGCSGTGATYTLVIGCNVITVTNPGVNTGTAGTPFSQTFTQTGGNGTIVWSETGALPAGISLNTSTGALFGTTSQTGSFPITVKATDANGCTGTGATYTLTINCETITVTNPGVSSVQAGVAFDQAFTATGILGTATWSEAGTLPTGITLNTSTGHLAGTTNAIGSYPITVTATDTNGCSGTGATYTLTVTCPTITVTRSGGGSFPAGVFNTAYTGQSVTASPASTYTFAVTSGSLPTGLSLSSAGAISGTPTATGNFTFTVTATDSGSLCTGSQSFSIAIAPSALNDSYGAANNIIDNVQFVITGGATTSPATPFVGATGNILTNDLPSGGVTATPGTFTTGANGSVTIAADGTFIYTPGVHAAAITNDTFTYTVVSNGVTSAPATVTLTLANRVWFVKNNGGAGDGRSHLPFNTLAAAQTASAAGDTIFVYNGNGSTTGQTAGITLKNNQKLIGEGVALVVNTVTLVPAGTKPQISNTTAASDAVTLADANTVQGLTITGATRDGIAGNTHAGGILDTLTLQNNAGAGLHLTSMTGVITVTNTTFTGNGTGLDINNGTAVINIGATSTITSSAGGRTVSIQNRPLSAGAITIDAPINDNGTGILVNNNLSGTIDFNGVLTLNTTTNTAISLTTNAGATITLPNLAITTTTGSGFNATGGGSLNVNGNVTTGAASVGININGMTVGGSGINFNNVATTGATTGVSLVNVNGTVNINGGPINGATTGIMLQGSTTNLTLSGTIIGGATTGITNTTNFGTLTLNNNNISGVTGLSLTGGTLAGTGTSISTTGSALVLNTVALTSGAGLTAAGSSGGVNGISLTGVTGGPYAIGGAAGLSGNSGAAFFVSGGNATVSYAGSITSTGFLVDSTGRTGGTLTLSGTLGGAGTLAGTGIRIQNSTGGTFTFSGTQTLGTSGSRMAATAVTLTTNTGATFNFNGTMSIFTGAVTAFSATAGGTINFSGTDSIDSSASALSLTGVALGAGTLSNLTAAGGVNGVALTTVTGGTLTISAGSISGATGASFLVSGGSVSVTDNGTVSQATATQPLVSVAAAHTGTLTFGANVTATNGTGLQFDNADGTYNFNGTTNSLNGGDAGIDITNGSGGTFSFSSGTSINNPTGVAYNEDTSTATVTYAGTITKNNNAANAVNINAKSAGTTTFSGAITGSTSTANAIDLTNSGGTVNFSGALTLTTTSGVAFNATTGGTVNVTNAGNTITVGAGGTGINWNAVTGSSTETFSSITGSGSGAGMVIASSGATNFTVGTVSTATGTAVSITTGTGDFIFTKISSNGAAKGISVTALTGGGSFTVNGTGGLCDSTHTGVSDCTGGTIAGGTTRGAEFTNVAALTLNNMYFNGNGTTAVACGDDVTGATNTTCNAGLFMSSVTAPSLTKIYANGTGSNGSAIVGNAVSAMTVSTLEIANFTNVAKTPFNFQNLTGTVGVTGLSVHNNSGLHNVMITNNTGTANITLTSPVLASNSGSGNPDQIQVNSYLAGTTLNITATNVNITASSVNTGNGVSYQANSGSTMTGILNGGVVTGTNGLLMQETGTNTTFTFTVTGLTSVTTHNLGSNAITVGKANGTNATFNGTVTNNVITSATCGGGCAGISVGSYGASGASTVNVSNNNISGVDSQGIVIQGGQGSSSLTATVQANNLHNPVAGDTSYAIDIYPGTQSGDAVCFAVNLGDMTAGHSVPANANIITGTWQSGGSPIEVGIFDNSIFKLLNYPNPGGTDAQAAAWVKASNGGLNVDAFHISPAGPFIAGAACP
jgi:hypothetical protein